MITISSRPIPAFLKNIAHRYLVFEGSMPLDNPFIQTIIPTLTEFCTFNLNEQQQHFYTKSSHFVLADSVASGLQTAPFVGHLRGNIRLIALQLYPSALFKLYGVPLRHLVNVNTTLRDLIGRPADILHERLLHTKNMAEACALIESFLLERIIRLEEPRGLSKVSSAMEIISQSKGTISTMDVAKALNFSKKTLQRIFIEHVGVPPKLYSGIHRFSEVIWNFNMHKQINTDLIYQLGYFDQAHFIHDFKKFSGQSPQSYFKTHPGWNEFFTDFNASVKM